MLKDPLDLFKLLSGGDLAASAAKQLGRPGSGSQIDWGQTPFRDLELIGRGGMGAVFRAHDQRLGRPVALKLLLSRSEASRLRFLREGRLAASLSHPNVVQVHDLLEFPKGDVLVCELLSDAQPLDQAWRELPLPRRVELIRDASRGVAAAHAAGIVHRDLKPENVLVDAEGRAQIADFGVAYGEDLERLTRSGTTLGTITFMAPEQLGVSRSQAPSAAADVWSLGVILYLALCDELPFQGTNLVQVAGALSKGLLSPQQQALKSSPPALAKLVRDCLQPDPQLRPSEASRFEERLTAWLARPTSASGSTSRAWILALAALLAALWGGLYLSGDRAPQPIPSPLAGAPTASVQSTSPSLGSLEARRRARVQEALRALEEPARAGGLGEPLAALLSLSGGVPAAERGVLEGRILDRLAVQILARDVFSEADQRALVTLAEIGARVRVSTGIRLVEAYVSQRSFERYSPAVQQSLFLTLLRLDVPTDYLSVDQFTQAFGPLGPPRGSDPWPRYTRLRSRVRQRQGRDRLLELLRQSPPVLRLGPIQEAEAISEHAQKSSEIRVLKDLERALERCPKSVPGLFLLVRARKKQGQEAAALAALERMLKALKAYAAQRVSRSYAGRLLHHAASYFLKFGDLDRARELVAAGADYPLTSTRTQLLTKHPELRD